MLRRTPCDAETTLSFAVKAAGPEVAMGGGANKGKHPQDGGQPSAGQGSGLESGAPCLLKARTPHLSSAPWKQEEERLTHPLSNRDLSIQPMASKRDSEGQMAGEVVTVLPEVLAAPAPHAPNAPQRDRPPACSGEKPAHAIARPWVFASKNVSEECPGEAQPPPWNPRVLT